MQQKTKSICYNIHKISKQTNKQTKSKTLKAKAKKAKKTKN